MSVQGDGGADKRVQAILDRVRAGDASAREELLRRCSDRLLRLTRKMFAGFPRLRRWVEEEDVLQNALLRLHRALRDVDVQTARHFFNLATVQIRRELHDLSHHFYGPLGIAANHQTGDGPPDERGGLIHNVPARTPDGKGWLRFHEAVEKLPPEQQEVVDLLFYEGLTHDETARVLGVSARTVKRRWKEVKEQLLQTTQREGSRDDARR
jgi:RNA polymerase sigma-70 factor (ECF subfamily)